MRVRNECDNLENSKSDEIGGDESRFNNLATL